MQKILWNVNTFHLHLAWLCIPLFVSVYIRISNFEFHFATSELFCAFMLKNVCYNLNEFSLRHKQIHWICFLFQEQIKVYTNAPMVVHMLPQSFILILTYSASTSAFALCLSALRWNVNRHWRICVHWFGLWFLFHSCLINNKHLIWAYSFSILWKNI